jgi:predicted SAM-dependent methyltransferase
MKETSKLYKQRLKEGLFKYLKGNGIDIGGGNDCLKVQNGTVDNYDKVDGNAQYMSNIKDNIYDFVYSSHCLEHLKDPEEGILNWLRILKPGGYLFVAVPDYTLYEKEKFPPSIYNPDHKWAFTLRRYRRKKVINVKSFLKNFEVDILFYRLNDTNYDYNNPEADQTRDAASAQIEFLLRKK